MAGAYIAELFRRVFWPTTRGADYVSVLIPLALATVAYFAGVKVSEDATVQILAYLGAFTLALFLVRLLATTPYAMWRERVAEAGGLRLELAKPERMVLGHLARHRADARVEIAALFSDMHTYAFPKDWKAVEDKIVNVYASIGRVQSRAHLGEAFQQAKVQFYKLCRDRVEGKFEADDYPDYELLGAIHAFLHGEITGEALALQLPKWQKESE